MQENEAPGILLQWAALLNERGKSKEAQDFYFDHILDWVIETARANPKNAGLADENFDVLISLMGFSPETTVIAAALLRPKTLTIVLSENVGQSYARAFDYLVNRRGYLKAENIRQEKIDPTNHFEIYRAIRGELQKMRVGQRAVVDVTGGKKIMSASAGQAAWELDLPLCYVESEAYNPTLRRPDPGSEVLLILPDASQQKAEQRRAEALELYRNHSYRAAADAFDRSVEWQDVRHFDEFARNLCAAYGSWTDLNLDTMAQAVAEVRRFSRGRAVQRWFSSQPSDLRNQLERNLAALSQVAEGHPMALVATFLELATLFRAQSRHDFAGILAYRAIEEMVDQSLDRLARTRGHDRFDPREPKYDVLSDDVPALNTAFGELWRSATRCLEPPPLPQRVGLMAGFALLCLLDGVHKRLHNGIASKTAVQLLMSLAEVRNSCVIVHGHRSLSEEDSKKLTEQAQAMAKALFERTGDPEPFRQLARFHKDLEPFDLDRMERE